jgi:hypothetical protein
LHRRAIISSTMLAFIVRPFGTRSGIDFERVEQELIGPVLDGLAIQGRTTQEIARAGNIRTDMFEGLLLADLVIADVSIHNANVYYELGVRHALRPRTTILIRAHGDDVPFDLRTDRYLEYSADDPGGARELLTTAIRQSVTADNVDSPVFALLPALEPSDLEAFRPVPEGFTEAVRAARRTRDLPMLAVLSDEAAGCEWRIAGERVVGRAQFDVGAWLDARATWEAVQHERPHDPEANLRLGTVYQRLGDPVASTTALEHVVGRVELPLSQQSEALALMARNAKDRWVADWQRAPESSRAAAGLRSPLLQEARALYDQAFMTDQNHWYPGVNALSLTVVALALGEREPGIWNERFETDDEAARARQQLEQIRDELQVAVRRSLTAAAFRSGESYDVWRDLSLADMRLVTSPDRPEFVAAAYAEARARMAEAGGGGLPATAVERQLRLYLGLGLFTEAAEAALQALGRSEQTARRAPRLRILVFAGHRIDASSRSEPRFPATSEDRAATMIRDVIAREKALAGGSPIEGMAGGASGGDILFHEICAEHGIPTTLLLALPPHRFAASSVEDAGPDWVERFWRLCDRLDTKVLAETDELPDWLAARKDYGVWQRNNRWVLHSALARADADVVLIVLWDGRRADGPGGTQDMMDRAQSRGVRVVRLDAAQLS